MLADQSLDVTVGVPGDLGVPMSNAVPVRLIVLASHDGVRGDVDGVLGR